jgi:hypothetical protein
MFDFPQDHRAVALLTNALPELMPRDPSGVSEAIDVDSVFLDAFDSMTHATSPSAVPMTALAWCFVAAVRNPRRREQERR